MDAHLVGYWSESALDPGSPEYTELGFRADGTGWQYWTSWSTAFAVHRFHWHTPGPGRLTTRLRMALDGTWSLDGPDVAHRIERREHVDTVVELGWELGPGRQLTLDQPLVDVLGGTKFLPVDGGGTDPTLTEH
ncbi:hypothetical protein OHS58_42545 [Amycolatopsis sp. NBC_00348]|uniref:hypothetical protein n=1 Tax=unclassified Amycolatopsis TaxID=2618356 RepID=UPI002E0E6167|nr:MULTISPECIES: hypothetical protein [unclassified Amycolatopsis]WSJ76252.1 hypothetical protein OG439_43820 [Amycolatopsis sp. NBC_01307]